jgi:hypothetical protein
LGRRPKPAQSVPFFFSLFVLSESIKLNTSFFTEPNKTALEGAEGATGTTADTAASQSQAQTKKQRQNAQRREALKEAKREREAQQQAAFVTHKRELERVRVADQAATTSKRTGSRFDSLG